jgi:hypothetical protein
VTKSRWPRAFARRTQKPFSALWKVTRSTRPASTSWVDDSGVGRMRSPRSPVFSPRATGTPRGQPAVRSALVLDFVGLAGLSVHLLSVFFPSIRSLHRHTGIRSLAATGKAQPQNLLTDSAIAHGQRPSFRDGEGCRGVSVNTSARAHQLEMLSLPRSRLRSECRKCGAWRSFVLPVFGLDRSLSVERRRRCHRRIGWARVGTRARKAWKSGSNVAR